MREDSLEHLPQRFEKFCSFLEDHLPSIANSCHIQLLNCFHDLQLGKTSRIFTLNFMTLWRDEAIQEDIWWQMSYDSQFKTLLLRAYFTTNGLFPKIQGHYGRIHALHVFQKLTEHLASINLSYQVMANPLTGNAILLFKIGFTWQQFRSNLVRRSFYREIFIHIQLMMKIMKKVHPFISYMCGKRFKIPEQEFFKPEKELTESPKAIYELIQAIFRQVDLNCEESFQIFHNIGKNKIVQQIFPQNLLKAINLLIGESNNVQQKFLEPLEEEAVNLISDSYDSCHKMESSGEEDMFLARQITILTNPYDIEWHRVGRGGFGLIQKAFVKYQLTDFNNFSQRSQIYEDFLIRKSDRGHSKKIMHEQEIFQMLKNQFHENIKAHYLPVQGRFSSYIFSKFQEYLSLDRYLQTNQKTISLTTILMFCDHIARGLLFLKEKDIVHLDIKSNNVLVSKNFKAQITDFGEAFYRSNPNKKYKHAYTIPYAPVQFFKGDRSMFNQKIDVHALGVTIYKAIYGKHIWGDLGPRNKFMQMHMKGEKDIQVAAEQCWRMGVPQILVPITNVIIKCVQKQQQKRPNLFYITIILSLCRSYLQRLACSDYLIKQKSQL